MLGTPAVRIFLRDNKLIYKGELTPRFIYELITAHKKNIDELIQNYHQEQNPVYSELVNTVAPESFKIFPKTAFPYDTIRDPVWFSNSATIIWNFLPQDFRSSLHSRDNSITLSRCK